MRCLCAFLGFLAAVSVQAQSKVPPSPVAEIEARIRKDLKLPPRPLPKATPEEFDSTLPTDSETGAEAVPSLPPLPQGKDRPLLLEQTAQQLRTAREALAYYELFLADPATTDEEKTAVQAKRTAWQKAAQDDLVRLGKKWVTRDEFTQAVKEVESLLNEARPLVEKKDYKAATARLEKAVRLDPEHVETQFLLGVAAYLDDDIPLAERRFNLALAEAPDSVAILTNLGLCAIQSKKPAAAVRHWAKAAALDPTNATLMQNLDKFVSDVMAKRLNVEKRIADQGYAAYQTMVQAKAPPGDRKQGYVLAKTLQRDSPKK